MIKKLSPATREEWLQIKKSGLGGSEIAAICGLSPYQTPRDIFMLKTGKEDYQESNWNMKLGTYLEGGIAELWQEESGYNVIKSSAKNVVYVHPKHSFLLGTPDRRFFYSTKEKGILEIKTTTGVFDYEEIPQQWVIQIQWYMGLTGLKRGILTWFEFRTKEMKSQEYEFEPELFNQLVEIGVDFWNNHVLTGTEPEAINSSDILKIFKKEEPGKVIEASTELQEVYSSIKHLQSQVVPINEQIETMKEQVKMVMRDAEKVKYVDQVLFTWKANKNGSRVFSIK